MFRLVQRHVGAKIALGYLIALALTIAISVLAIVWLGQINSTLDDLTRHLTMDQDLADAIARQTLLTRFYVAWLILATLAAILVGGSLAVLISRGITAPLEQVTHTAQQITNVDLKSLTTQLESLAQGNLALDLHVTAQRLAVQSKDQVGQTARAFNEIIESFHQAEQAFRNMAAYLQEMAAAAQSVAEGDLSVSVNVRSQQDVLGNAIAQMLANLRAAEERAQRQLQRLETLRRVDTLITASADLRPTLQFLLGQLVQHLRVDAAEILLLNSQSGTLERFAWRGFQSNDDVYRPARISETCAGRVLAKGHVVSIADLKTSDLSYLLEETGEDFCSYVGLPLAAQGQIKGVLQVLHHRPLDPDPEWMGFLETLAGQTAIAIDNAQLIQNLEDRVAVRTMELQQQALQMQTASEIAHVANSTLDLTRLLQESVELIRDRSDLYYVGLFLSDDQDENLWLRAGSGEAGRQMLALQHKLPLDGASMVAWCVQHSQPRIAQDVGADAVHRHNPLLPNTGSEAALPLITRGQVIGALSVQSDKSHAFGEAEVTILQAMAGQLANAIGNARLFAQVQELFIQAERRAARMTVLNEIGRALSTTLQPEDLYRLIYQQAKRVLKMDAFYIGLYDESQGTLHLPLRYDEGQFLEPITRPLDQGPASRVVRAQAPVVVNHAGDPIQEEGWLWGDLQRPGASAMHVPMMLGDQVVGVLSTQSYEPEVYTSEDTLVLQVIASQAAIAIENARLYASLQQELAERTRAEKLEQALYRISEAANVAQSLDALFRLVHEIVGELIPANNFFIALYDAATDTISFPYFVDEQDAPPPPRQFITYKPERRITEYVFELGRLLLVARPEYERLVESGEFMQIGSPPAEWLGVPLKTADGKTIGVLAVRAYTTGVHYGEEEAQVLSFVSTQIAMAIERKRAEEQLQRASVELAESNEELKRFTYIVSHDLRAPLVNLKGFAVELRSALESAQPVLQVVMPLLDEKQKKTIATALMKDVPEAVSFIEASATRMDHFINALLRLSRLGRREMSLEQIDMAQLVRDTLETLAHQIEQRQVAITLGKLPDVTADRTSMEQILSNILNNAIIYLEPGRPGQINVWGERHADETVYHVRDNGRGIAAEDMDKVFGPFRRAGRQDVPGEGMGLTYVQALVRRHNGRIWCESQLGVGTTFLFTISNHLKGRS